MSAKKKKTVIEGSTEGRRVPSRVLEEQLQQAVQDGAREILVRSDGQHGIGGRIWPCAEAVKITVEGPSGQRLGSMGMMGTEITVKGGVSDDVGWINCGARITVLGDVTNGAHNAAAQGVLYVQGGGGARCDTMTKHNPRFAPPESWYFRGVGDSFAEFKAGGISVVCGVDPRHPDNILGYRPCVGMVGGAVYFRGPIKDYSKRDVKLLDVTDADWEMLKKKMKPFLKAIGRTSHYEELTKDQGGWRKLIAYTPKEKFQRRSLPMSTSDFRESIWEQEVGRGGIFAEYLTHEQTLLPYVTTGENRRNKPLWSNHKYAPPCAYNCPSNIPSHRRATLIRQGRTSEALELVLKYSPLPATVCGQVCPNLCMQSCTRGMIDKPLDMKELGTLALDLPAPKPAKPTGHKVAVIGGGPAGLSAAWQLALGGHEVDLYEAEKKLGGKVELCIPRERLPQDVLKKELSRFRELGVNVYLGKTINKKSFEKIHKEHDVVIVACGAHWPRKLDFAGSEHTTAAIDFLKEINFGNPPDLKDKEVVVIGAGNVGMDVACEAYNAGARAVTAVDVQKPAAFGKELQMATHRGTEIMWPRFTEKYEPKAKKISFTDGTSLRADLVVLAIGETPVVDFLPAGVHTERGWIAVDEIGQTSDSKVYAIGDATKPGLVTHAIGQGRDVAKAINSHLSQYDYMPEVKQPIPYEKIRTAYYERQEEETVSLSIGTPGLQTSSGQTGSEISSSKDTPEATTTGRANLCLSCGACRDCRMCVAACYPGAISRQEDDGVFEYVVDDEKCTGCGFCAGICPCGVWEMVENT